MAKRIGFVSLWLAAGTGLLLLVPVLEFGAPVWEVPARRMIPPVLAAAAFLAGVVWLALGFPVTVRLLSLLGWSGAFAAGVSFVVLLLDLTPERTLMALLTGLVGMLIYLPFLARHRALGRNSALGVVLVGLVSLLVLNLTKAGAPEPPATETSPVESTVLDTSLYDVNVTTYQKIFPWPERGGGAIEPIADGFLAVNGDGDFFLFSWPDGGDEIAFTPLPYQVPGNFEQFDADAHPSIVRRHFRFADLLVREAEGNAQLLATHHFWKSDEQCIVTRLSSAEVDTTGFLGGSAELEWVTLFESTPCLPLTSEGDPFFYGMQIGGRMSMLDQDTVLFAVGDHGFDGHYGKPAYPQDPSNDVGKFVTVDLTPPYASERFTLGNRNPQGLYIDSEGTIWSTEHGPQGGDELNVIVPGGNYGWPQVTFGTDYASKGWYATDMPGDHQGYDMPVYAWVPSIGVSSVIRLAGTAFPGWQGDLLVASLSGRQLQRIRMREGRPVVIEPIDTGDAELRDIHEAPDRLIIYTEQASLVTLEPAEEGAQSLAQRLCAGCHSLDEAGSHGIGPSLVGVFGRRIATASGFTYTDALLAHQDEQWTEQRLRAFLQDPDGFAPGTAMSEVAVTESEKLDQLLRELRALH